MATPKTDIFENLSRKLKIKILAIIFFLDLKFSLL